VDRFGVRYGGSERASAPRPRRPAPAGVEIQLDVGRAGRDGERFDGGVGERGPAEVGVDDDAGRIEYGAQRRRLCGQRRDSLGQDVVGRDLAAPARACAWTTTDLTVSRPSTRAAAASRGSTSS
jgi:hypothetical protein